MGQWNFSWLLDTALPQKQLPIWVPDWNHSIYRCCHQFGTRFKLQYWVDFTLVRKRKRLWSLGQINRAPATSSRFHRKETIVTRVESLCSIGFPRADETATEATASEGAHWNSMAVASYSTAPKTLCQLLGIQEQLPIWVLDWNHLEMLSSICNPFQIAILGWFYLGKKTALELMAKQQSASNKLSVSQKRNNCDKRRLLRPQLLHGPMEFPMAVARCCPATKTLRHPLYLLPRHSSSQFINKRLFMKRIAHVFPLSIGKIHFFYE